MGNEISTVGGAVGVAATSVAAGVCFGQVESLNKAVVETSQFTAKKFMDTNVRHVGELAGGVVAVAGCAVASGVCLGLNDSLNQAVISTAKYTGRTGCTAAKKLGSTLNDTADAVPVVGHVKGVIHYAVGDHEGGHQAMKASSRTVGVLGGGAAGFLVGGPVGAVAGGVVGGATMDGVTTAIDSNVHGQFRPSGQIASWHAAINGKNTDEQLDGVIGVILAPVMDAAGGYAAGEMVAKFNTTRTYRVMNTVDAEVAVENQKLFPARNQGGPLGETCVTESAKHSKDFSIQRAQTTGSTQSTVQMNLDSSAYSKIKSDAIPQRGSSTINNGASPVKNVYTTENLAGHPQNKINLNIKGPDNLAKFNDAMQKVKIVDPTQLASKTAVEKTVGRYVKRVAQSSSAEAVANASTHSDE